MEGVQEDEEGDGKLKRKGPVFLFRYQQKHALLFLQNQREYLNFESLDIISCDQQTM